MARDLNNLAAVARQQKEKENVDRYEKLATTVTGLFSDIIDSTFPETAAGDPDWDKFNWTKAEQLQQLLTDFQAGRTSRRPRDDDRAQQPSNQPPAPEPVAPVVVPVPVTPDDDDDDEPAPVDQTTPVKKTVRQRIADLRQNS